MHDFLEKSVLWFGQFSLLIKFSGLNIFIDPFNIPAGFPHKADFIFITHSHFDHLAPDDIRKIAIPETVFVAPDDCIETIQKFSHKKIYVSKPQTDFNFDKFAVRAVPMYNIVKTQFHPKKNNWTGYVFNLDGLMIYITGDTEKIPEMTDIQTDIIFLPLGQTYTMNSVAEAVEVVETVKAKIAVPMHFGLYEGTKRDADLFCSTLKHKNIDCKILSRFN